MSKATFISQHERNMAQQARGIAWHPATEGCKVPVAEWVRWRLCWW